MERYSALSDVETKLCASVEQTWILYFKRVKYVVVHLHIMKKYWGRELQVRLLFALEREEMSDQL